MNFDYFVAFAQIVKAMPIQPSAETWDTLECFVSDALNDNYAMEDEHLNSADARRAFEALADMYDYIERLHNMGIDTNEISEYLDKIHDYISNVSAHIDMKELILEIGEGEMYY